MKVLSTAAQITQAFKNAGRVRHIGSVFAKYGFSEVIQRMRLSRFVPFRHPAESTGGDRPAPERLRMAFEELGPTFVKLGQLLSTRADLFPEEYTTEFRKLQDRVGALPYPEIRRVLERELGDKLSDTFEFFEESPMAAASIAQVHGAQLKTGERVAVKIQRPGIEKTILSDISILRGISILMEKYVPETEVFNPTGIVDEFFKSILFELDFFVEANNMRRIRKNLESFKKVAIPKVFSECSTSRILVLERFDGIRFSDRAAIVENNIDPVEVVQTGAEAFFLMVMRDGAFHADLHAGNLFILVDGRIGFIDFGIVGRLSRRSRESVISMFLAIMDEDYETLASEYMNLCQVTSDCNLSLLQADLMDLISPYVGMVLGNVNIGRILLQSTSVAARHHLKVPRELMMLFKAIFTIEALGKRLDPTFDTLQMGTKLAKQTLSIRYSREQILKDLIVIGRDVQHLAESSPRLMKRFLRRWSKNDFVFETKSRDVEGLSESIHNLSHSLMTSMLSLFLCAVGITFIVLDLGTPLWGVSLIGLILISLGIFLVCHRMWKFRRRIK